MTPALTSLKFTTALSFTTALPRTIALPFTTAVPNPDREGGASSGTRVCAGAPQ